MADIVLLTGISGYVGGHLALALLEKGYVVRGSVRSAAKAAKVRDTLAAHGADPARLDIVTLDLLSDAGWSDAMAGVRYLQHTASPFVTRMPEDRMDLVRPAVEGTRRAISAALDAGVERSVVTSSMAAIMYGHDPHRSAPFGAADWTDLKGRDVNAYVESKTRAEQLAWDLVGAAGRRQSLATINPGAILGPLLDDDPGTSAGMLIRLMNGSVPAAPRISFIVADVRDVAEAHVAAMERPEAGGQRFPMGEGTYDLLDVAQMLRTGLGPRAGRLPRLRVPNWVIRLYAPFDRDLRDNLGELDVVKRVDASAVTALLGHPLRPTATSVVDTAQSLIAQGLA